jgi:CHAT domain-containing protein
LIPSCCVDGLTFKDILTELDLRQTRLVTLSACDTGIVDVSMPWDEVVGLANTFLQAGAGATVSSLWEVGHRSTALLMERFYHHVVDEGMSLGAALREAQIWLRSSTRRALDEYYTARALADMAVSHGCYRSASAAFTAAYASTTP